MTTASDGFLKLLQAYAQSVGLSMSEGEDALEFESDDLTVFISVDPRLPTRLMVQVRCFDLMDTLDKEAQATIAWSLHHLNSVAQFEHDWVATVDPALVVRLHSQFAIAELTGSDLDPLICEGMHRGQALREMLQSLQDSAQTSPHVELAASGLPQAGFLRG